MVAGAWLQLDLLARRREQLGLARPQPLPVRQLLIRGAVIGGVLPLLFLLAGLFLLLQDRLLAAQEEQLAPSAFAYDGLQQRMQELLVQIDTAKTTNRSIAEAMADVRSSSAVLGELKQILPSEMVLDEVKTGGNQLALKGAALQPEGARQPRVGAEECVHQRYRGVGRASPVVSSAEVSSAVVSSAIVSSATVK